MRSMSWAFLDGFVLVVHADRPPDDDEWKLYVQDCAARVGVLRGGLASTDGHGPNATQRGLVIDHDGLIDVPFAIVTGSLVVRGIVTALRWLGKNIRAFSPDQMDEVFAYLGVTNGYRSEIHDKLVELRMSLLDDGVVDSLNSFSVEQRDEYVLSTSLALIRREMEEVQQRMRRIGGSS